VEEVISAYQSLNPTKLNKDDFTLAPLQEKIDNIFSASTKRSSSALRKMEVTGLKKQSKH